MEALRGRVFLSQFCVAMSQGTLLSDLGNAPGGNDGDLVQQILQDMNAAPAPSNPVVQSYQAPPPPMGPRMPMQQAPPGPQTTFPQAADPAVPTAHMIGREHPTAADFQRMMMAGSGPSPFQPLPPVQQAAPEPPAKNWQAQWAEEFKIPVLVAIVCLLVTLPAVNLLIAH